MTRQLLRLVRQSIRDGYLPPQWHDQKNQVVLTATGMLTLLDHCAAIGSTYYHKVLDVTFIIFDEVDYLYILRSESISVNVGTEASFCTHMRYASNCYLYEGRYYDVDGLSASGLTTTLDGRVIPVAVLSEEQEQLSDTAPMNTDTDIIDNSFDEDDDDHDHDEIWPYHEGPVPDDYRNNEDEAGIGFEIEKGGPPEFCGFWSKEDLYHGTGCIMEKDGSVDWELKTPVYPLFSPKIEIVWLPQIRQALNADNHINAGGHIHLSLPPKCGQAFFDYCRPYLPLFMSMYPDRLKKNYCKGKTERLLKADPEKHQAIRIWPDRIELRFPAKVYDMNVLLFRLSFCRLMVSRAQHSILAVTLAAFDKSTELGKLIQSQYSGKESMLLERVLHVALEYFNTDLSKERDIKRLLNRLKSMKTCA
ncbi:MAG TPA: hypothetical protein VM802_01095 [Chitinophaga sp.]|uniref:hypothetical protein n=1 Tax=Chitinophaga sp. TaxID=1869181 RepID=UPI002D198621|nr:hypothetical protein [Chitinophaga sp.]HVI43428.1 hypothetical protein [Chitinophaga sp.]